MGGKLLYSGVNCGRNRPWNTRSANLEALQRNVDMTRDLGFIRAKLDVKQYTDLSIVREAAERLK